MDDIPKFDPSKAAIEDFDPDLASPAEWAAMYRASALKVVPASRRASCQGQGVEAPETGGMASLQESLIDDASLRASMIPAAST